MAMKTGSYKSRGSKASVGASKGPGPMGAGQLQAPAAGPGRAGYRKSGVAGRRRGK